MTTFGQMVDEVNRKLAGFTLRQDRQTHLTSAITSTATTINVGSAQNISTGIIEIDDELIYVDAYDRNNGIITIPPYGRGYMGTTPASHQVGSKVVISPTFPTVDIKNAINDTIMAISDRLFAVGTHTFSYNVAKTTYAIPAEADNILDLVYETTGPTKEWAPIRAWRVEKTANTTAFTSGKAITLMSPVEPGRTVQVTYSYDPLTLDLDEDEFDVVTGLPQSAKDVIILGASFTLASFVDPGRLTFGSAEADQQSQIAGRAYGAGTNAAKYLLALYTRRLEEEIAKLQKRYPTRIHRTL